MSSPFEETFGYAFHDPGLLERALTHPSARNENPDLRADNQRLEYLGDAVLELVVSELLYRRYPDADEGMLTRCRANLVRTDRLASLARALGIGEELRLGRGERLSGGADKDSILADAYEAVLGAVYLDGGLDGAAACVRRHIDDALLPEGEAEVPQDPKSRLQEETQRSHRVTPRYELLAQHGPDHDRCYVVAVDVPGLPALRGEGASKKSAEQAAAAAALSVLAHDGEQDQP